MAAKKTTSKKEVKEKESQTHERTEPASARMKEYGKPKAKKKMK